MYYAYALGADDEWTRLGRFPDRAAAKRAVGKRGAVIYSTGDGPTARRFLSLATPYWLPSSILRDLARFPEATGLTI